MFPGSFCPAVAAGANSLPLLVLVDSVNSGGAVTNEAATGRDGSSSVRGVKKLSQMSGPHSVIESSASSSALVGKWSTAYTRMSTRATTFLKHNWESSCSTTW